MSKRFYSAEEAADIIQNDIGFIDEVAEKIDRFFETSVHIITPSDQDESFDFDINVDVNIDDMSIINLNENDTVDSDSSDDEPSSPPEEMNMSDSNQLNANGAFNDTEHDDLQTTYKRKRKAHPSSWKQNVNKKRRAMGLQYMGLKCNSDTGKWDMVVKEKRKMGPPCSKISCARSKAFNCNKFSEDDRTTIFNQFWSSANKELQNLFIRSLVDVKPKVRSTALVPENSSRKNSRVYKLKKDGATERVCKTTFLNTLGISQRKVEVVFEDNPGIVGTAIGDVTPKPRNPRPSRGFKWDEDDQKVLVDFFNDIPKAPSHYCRKDSSKVYLTKIVTTMAKLFQIYQSRCAALGRKHFSYWKFSEYFNEKGFSLFKRKKDECNTCVAYEEKNVSEEEFIEHQKRKNQGFVLKQADKDHADGVTTLVVTADTEGLLQAPLNFSNMMYFHSKLNIHNLTFYELKSKDVLNYVWSEVHEQTEANNFVSCYVDYLKALVRSNPQCSNIILWSDGCTCQNKCNILASAILSFVVESGVTVHQKYLEVGHTHFECDSVHSTIENSLKRKESQFAHRLHEYNPFSSNQRKTLRSKVPRLYFFQRL